MSDGIHNYKKKLERETKNLYKKLSKKEANQIMNYIQALAMVKNIGLPRQVRVIQILGSFRVNYLKKPYKKATKKDLINAVQRINETKLTVWTKSTIFKILKMFFRFIKWGMNGIKKKEYPELINWLHAYPRKLDLPKLSHNDILTEEEVKNLIESANTNQTKAFLSILYESGGRISEVGNARVRDIYQDQYSYLVHLRGKTGERDVRLILSSPHLRAWLNEHPLRSDQNASLWVDKNGKGKSYSALKVILKRTALRANINKRVYPHLMRHTRCSHLIQKGLNEQELKKIMGWTPDSRQLDTYSHISNKNANDKLLQIYGVTKKKEEVFTKKCLMCEKVNDPKNTFCWKCGRSLDVKSLLKAEEIKDDEKKKFIEMLSTSEVIEFIKKLRGNH